MKVRALPTCRKPVGEGAKRTLRARLGWAGLGASGIKITKSDVTGVKKSIQADEPLRLALILICAGQRTILKPGECLPRKSIVISPFPVKTLEKQRRVRLGTHEAKGELFLRHG